MTSLSDIYVGIDLQCLVSSRDASICRCTWFSASSWPSGIHCSLLAWASASDTSNDGRDVVRESHGELVEGIPSIGEFLHVDRILIDFGDDGISPILEDVDDVSGFDLCLLSTLLLLGPSHELELTPFIATLG